MIILGVDVGLLGGIAVLDEGQLIAVYDMPVRKVPYKKKTRNVVDGKALYEIFNTHAPNLIVVETVGSMTGQGVTSSFNFGYSAGVIYGCASAFWEWSEIQFIRPQSWKKRFNLIGTSKDQARILCLEMFASNKELFKLKKNGGRADAALIAMAAYLDNEKE